MMRKFRLFLPLALLCACAACNNDSGSATSSQPPTGTETLHTSFHDSLRYRSPKLELTEIAPEVYVHTSYLQTNDFGKVACNGMLLIRQGTALIFDTPADDSASIELLAYLQKQQIEAKAVVATHFHADCVGGFNVFQDHHIPSYSSRQTALLQAQHHSSYPSAQHLFQDSLKLYVGDAPVYITYYGAGHTQDNVVAYYPPAKVLFGGCLIKASGADKGNLEDADTAAWSATIHRLQQQVPDVKLVIPGHGQWGGPELLRYTRQLFRSDPPHQAR